MRIDLRCDSEGKFGFVEKYKPYVYDGIGAVQLRATANAGGYISVPYVFRGGLFIPVKQIEEEMGIGKYIKAKKPFYSVMGTGNLIMDIRVAFNLESGEYLKDKSVFKLYGVVKDSLVYRKDVWSVELRRLTSSSSELDNWLESVARSVASTGLDREMFLKTRF